MRSRVILGAAAIGALVVAASAEVGRGGEQASAGRIVLASVTDARNRPMVDLDADDFVIDELGEVREVYSVYVADYPVVVLVDDSYGARNDLQAIRDAVTRFISRIGLRPIVVGTLANPPEMLTSFEDDRATVLARVQGLSASRATALMPLQAVAEGGRAVQAMQAPFSAIVVVTAHVVDAARPRSPGDLRTILESGAFVHVVSRRAPTAGPRGTGAAPRLEADLLRELAELTRGQYTTVFSAASYVVALDRIADRLATEMMVEYLVPPESLGVREVKVGVRIAGARVTGLGVSR